MTSWSSLEASLLHVGWDGEAFSVFSFNQADLSLRLVRLSVDGTLLVGETVVVLDPAASKPVQDRVPWVRDDGWWLAHYVAIEGIQSLRFDGAQPELEGLLIDHDSCYLDSSCLGVTHHDFLPARFLQAEGRDDDRWFGFWDLSDCFEAPAYRGRGQLPDRVRDRAGGGSGRTPTRDSVQLESNPRWTTSHT